MMKRLLIIFFTLFTINSFAAPKADLWRYWNSSNQASKQIVDHAIWQKILDDNLTVKGQNHLFDYENITTKDRQALKIYIQNLTQLDPLTLNKKEQFAYWVNLYNALTINLILDNYPVKSITKLGGLFSFGPWDQGITTINNKELTLNDIEHRILRPIWKDKRIHYAVNCASLGCPNLASKAFTSSNSEALLVQAEEAFISSTKGVEIKNNKILLSSIYKWYAIDFGGESGVINYLTRFHPELRQIKANPSYDYNWSLNKK